MIAIQHEDILITDNDELKIYVIGYNYEGESILLTIGDTKFVGVIDCYKSKNEFITKNILDELKVKKLDFICWTHDDWDHTYGLSQLEQYVKKDTAIILSEGITPKKIQDSINNEELEEYHAKEFQNIYEMIRKVDSSYIVWANQSTSIFSFNLALKGSEKSHRFLIDSFAPISGIINEYSEKSLRLLWTNTVIEDDSKKVKKNWYCDFNKDSSNNLYSVGLKVVVDGNDSRINICLSGDLDNRTIEKMNENNRKMVFGKNTLFKIPHHCSKEADALFALNCIEQFQYGVTTSFRNKLPSEEMIKKYKDKCVSLARTDLGKGDYGVVVYRIILKNLEVLHPTYENAAGECYL